MTNNTRPAPHSTEAIIAAQLASIEVAEVNLADIRRIAETPAAKRSEADAFAHAYADERSRLAFAAINKANANLARLGYAPADPFADFDIEVAA